MALKVGAALSEGRYQGAEFLATHWSWNSIFSIALRVLDDLNEGPVNWHLEDLTLCCAFRLYVIVTFVVVFLGEISRLES